MATYSYEENAVSKVTSQIIIEIIIEKILKWGIDDTLQIKIVLLIIYIKNFWLTYILEKSISPIKK